ncbi:MAG TPA: BlaI/MecI/CopY family transcriptional regulator [Tepidisphaeraceae bacterium]|nr:BlaI/MecI/CopY family transcriptional regulator [Tepidisphaeraceae bacterium]
MPKVPHISDAEWIVMEVLWTSSPLTANQIVESLGKQSGWNPRTIKTMLNRLVKKGAIKYETEGKRYLYRPAISRDVCVKGESRSFIQRVFGGNVGPMLAHFVEETKLTPEQVRELRKLLEDKE